MQEKKRDLFMRIVEGLNYERATIFAISLSDY